VSAREEAVMTISARRLSGVFLLSMTALAVHACRPRTEETKRESAEQKREADRTTELEPKMQAPPAASERVGTTELSGATTQSEKPSTSVKLPTNLPPFEGELKLDVRNRTPESLDYAMKGDKIRLGLSSAPGMKGTGIDAIIDTDDQKATILFKDRKQFVDVDLAKVAEKAKQRLEDVKVERTGKMHDVAGRSCEEWRVEDRDVRVTACVMKGGPYFDLGALEAQGGFKAPAWAHSIVDAGYIPLRVTIGDPSGTTWGTSEITDASRKVDPSQFEIPVGYTKADLGRITEKKK
jgi:hypothetical protein